MSLATVGAELKEVNNELMRKAGDPNASLEDVDALEKKKAQLQKRFDIIKSEHDFMEEEQKKQFHDKIRKNGIEGAKNDEERLIAAKAEFIRAKVLGKEISPEAQEILATTTPLRALPAGGGTGGENFLPTTLSNEVIHEPFVKNPLRGKIGMSAIKGLELPKIAFELDDCDFITDAGTAEEIETTGDKVEFGKFKFKVKVRLSDTVLHGSDVELVQYVENALRSGLAAKERKVSFAHGAVTDPVTSPRPVVAAEKHMTFYEVDAQSASVIKEVTGEDMFEAITNAIAALHEDFRENAQVCMRYSDYVTMIKALSNGAVDLYGKQPEEVIGKPVFFSDAAAIYDTDGIYGRPIVGDFNYMHLNYDPSTIYDSDKDVDKGEYIWVLTAWLDQRKKLASAFRIAKVVESL
ncbi:phage major capsid protein [Candidatus Contubernalis alkalaceticus]|nr:phage major capsid protein [Candidatus Contubernalis alkalaceticus]